MDIAQRLKAWRHALGLTQSEFARRAGLSKATLIGYEVGQRKPGAEALGAIARTGVNMVWLLTGDGEMWPNHVQSILKGIEALGENRATDEDVARMLRQIETILAADPDPDRRRARAAELFSRAQEFAHMDELEQAVAELKTALKKAR